MSTAAAAYGRSELGAEPTSLWSVLIARLTRFLDALPAHYDDIDPDAFKLPTP